MNQVLQNLNVFAQCGRYNVGLWSCPQFLFVIMGVVIISAILFTYVIGQRYAEPEIVALIVLLLAGFLLIVGYVIVGTLERLVDVRMREAAQSKELLRLKDQFIFVAAHELRTPANTIKWGFEILQKRQPDCVSREKGLFEMLEESNERLLMLVEDLLEVARIEGRTIKIKLTNVSVAEAATDAVREIRELADGKKVFIRNEIAGDFPLVLGNLMRLKEVFVNLLSNAIKYNKKDGGVWIKAEKKGNHVVVHIIDNGTGISSQNQKHIFEKFWRAPEVQGIEGTGLGLFITKQLILLMKGKIWFTTEPGKGSTFSFSLQCKKIQD